jgi:hypothetical protein
MLLSEIPRDSVEASAIHSWRTALGSALQKYGDGIANFLESAMDSLQSRVLGKQLAGV